MFLSCLSGSLAGVAPVDISQFDMLPRRFLNRFGQLFYLSTLLLVGRSNQSGEEIAEGIHSYMHFAAALFLMPIVACTGSAFNRGLQSTCIEDDCAGLLLTSLSLPQHLAQVGHDVGKASGFDQRWVSRIRGQIALKTA